MSLSQLRKITDHGVVFRSHIDGAMVDLTPERDPKGTRIVSVRFFFDAGQPSRTDHRAPYRLRFRLGFPPGSRHVAAAIVRYRLPGERRVRSVRIGRTFVMC